MAGIQFTEGRKSHGAAPSGGVVILRSAPKVVRNSASAVKDNVFVYWVSPKGEIQPAADSRITQEQLRRWPQYRHWRRCEAIGAREIEKVSVIISRQMWEKKQAMKVEQHLREKGFLDMMKVRCKLRMAQAYSKNDLELNKKILKKTEMQEANLYRAIAAQFDPKTRTTALEIEMRPQSTSKVATIAQKRQGVA